MGRWQRRVSEPERAVKKLCSQLQQQYRALRAFVMGAIFAMAWTCGQDWCPLRTRNSHEFLTHAAKHHKEDGVSRPTPAAAEEGESAAERALSLFVLKRSIFFHHNLTPLRFLATYWMSPNPTTNSRGHGTSLTSQGCRESTALVASLGAPGGVIERFL